MKKVIDSYRKAYKEHGNSLASLFIPKGRQSERFDSLTTFMVEDASILDFGCGFGHLAIYLKNKFSNFKYEGCDIVGDFITKNNKEIGDGDELFYLIDDFNGVEKKYDFIVAAGVFNLLYSDSLEFHVKIVQETISHLFKKTNKVLSINFMTDQVDFQAPGSYHQNVVEIYNYCNINLSKRIVVDQSYMPFEYTIHVFKDDSITDPVNVYKAHG